MCARSVLLYAAPVWAGAPRTYMNKLQVMQNKFLRISLNVPKDTKITELHKMANMESIDEVISKMLSGTFNHEHINPLISKTGQYDIQNLPFRIRCRLPKHFQPINTFS